MSNKNILDIMEERVKQFRNALLTIHNETRLHNYMRDLIADSPEVLHKHLFLKFTFMLGYSIGCTREEVINVLGEKYKN